jgi:hypothetical protein
MKEMLSRLRALLSDGGEARRIDSRCVFIYLFHSATGGSKG